MTLFSRDDLRPVGTDTDVTSPTDTNTPPPDSAVIEGGYAESPWKFFGLVWATSFSTQSTSTTVVGTIHRHGSSRQPCLKIVTIIPHIIATQIQPEDWSSDDEGRSCAPTRFDKLQVDVLGRL